MQFDQPALVATTPFWRNKILPIFTPKQFTFAVFALTIYALIAVSWPNGVYFGLIVPAAFAGALSLSSPYILIGNSKHIRSIESALATGGWVQQPLGFWRRPTSIMKSWENDQVEIFAEPRIFVATGPYYTLKVMRGVLNELR